ncbi:hypothetical protein GCK72_008170 [Caenorhabditis remanei]|uniref:Uncharacterized protein n=1 Tax=Caenorhabditis remanei TaxID=31234 RepID=E3MNU4_CAERE|nr:hypothetical protein GCK72_008170 [Caenorhabditis remanei]EFP06209.1 hypothetical protein CRE_06790 [Caenorhabditis remanei]KAF1759925.1 hypothetical protein GCK72_008170 [Caenorhabditis remanei]
MRNILTFLIFALVINLHSAAAEDSQEKDNNGITKHQNIQFSSPHRNMASGAIVGGSMNAARYAIENGGRASNIVNVFDKAAVSSLGNPKWYARVDMPHANVPYHHINVNKAITGLKDPHIRISGATAHAAGAAGKVLNAVNKVAPAALIASVILDAVEIADDYNKGRTEEVQRKVISKTSSYFGGAYGATAGAAYGSAIFPGVGTLIGGVVGGLFGGVFGGIGGDVVAEMIR